MYCIGDIQGCHQSLQRLLATIDFSPSRDTLYVLGDLVNRGPDSLGVLRFLSSLGSAAHCLLGNHDLHLLAVWQGVRKMGSGDTFDAVLQAHDADDLLHWLRHRALALHAHGWLMVHAGVLPQWSVEQTISLAAEVQSALQKPDFRHCLASMYGSQPTHWDDALTGFDRFRVIVNALTRLRFCNSDGSMNFSAKEGTAEAPAGLVPWFAMPQRKTQNTSVVIGHWSTLYKNPHQKVQLLNHVLPLDTGCVWGGRLTAARLEEATHTFRIFSSDCSGVDGC